MEENNLNDKKSAKKQKREKQFKLDKYGKKEIIDKELLKYINKKHKREDIIEFIYSCEEMPQKETRQKLEEEANKGNECAILIVAMLYDVVMYEICGYRDIKKAIHYYNILAEKGDRESKNCLGALYAELAKEDKKKV